MENLMEPSVLQANLRSDQPSAGTAFKILSLDGGGIRGAYAASFLAHVEAKLKISVAEYFDLIAGTSTGGIIAVALAMGIPAHRIAMIYREHGKEIFARRPRLKLPWWRRTIAARFDKWLEQYGLDFDGLLQSKYEANGLRRLLNNEFGDMRLGNATTRLVIPSVNLTTGQTKVFKTPHLPGLSEDRHRPATDVILATTAAPTYFPHAVIGLATYTDGGLWANNPSMVALVEAERIRSLCRRPTIDPVFDLKDVFILSIGAGSSRYSYNPPAGGAGLGWWGPHLYEIMAISQAQSVDFQVRHMLGPDRYRRIDFLPVDSTWQLDNTERVGQLLGMGEGSAIDSVSSLTPIFFRHKITRYKPFPEVGEFPQ
jgi:patatin-like phospholipase/acyl hydrolase